MRKVLLTLLLTVLSQTSLLLVSPPASAESTPLYCSLILGAEEGQSAEFLESYRDGLDLFAKYPFLLSDMGLLTDSQIITPDKRFLPKPSARALIQSHLTPEEIALIHQINAREFGNAQYSNFILSKKIRAIFQNYAQGAPRNSQLLKLRKDVYIRSADIERVFKEKLALVKAGHAVAGQTELYDEDGLQYPYQLQSYDELKGVATIRSAHGEELTLPIGDIYGRMPDQAVKNWGFAPHELWQYGKTQAYIYEVIWQKISENQTAKGPVTLMTVVHEPEQPSYKIFDVNDLRFMSKKLAFMRELGFSYSEESGIQTVPSLEVINANLDRIGLTPFRLVQTYDRKEAADFVFARALVRNEILVGIELMQVHDYTAHLAERLALPPEIFAVLQSQLSFWLSVYDNATLKQNKNLRKLSELKISEIIFKYDNLLFTPYLVGFERLGRSNEIAGARDVLSIHANELFLICNESAYEVAQKVYRQINQQGGKATMSVRLHHDTDTDQAQDTITVNLSREEQEVYSQLALGASQQKLTIERVEELLSAKTFLENFTTESHPLRRP